jgi:EAL domain-containing protein (putative c-di-GMP-specific phosphodiesterase class I)/GGDEF domain-containing protein
MTSSSQEKSEANKPTSPGTATPQVSRMISWSHALKIFVLTALACLAAHMLSVNRPELLLIWLPSGLAMALAWRLGAWSIAPVALGALMAALATYSSSPAPLGTALATLVLSSLGPWAGIFILKRLIEWKPVESNLEGVIRFIGVALLVVAPINALAMVALSEGFGLATFLHPVEVLIGWWLIDSLGSLLISPVVNSLFERDEKFNEPSARITSRPLVYLQYRLQATASIDLSALAATAAVIAGAMMLVGLGQRNLAYGAGLMAMPIAVWIAIRCDNRTTAFSLLLTVFSLLALRSFLVNGSLDGFDKNIEMTAIGVCASLAALIIQASVTDRKLALEKLGRQSRQDMSTGLLNDRGLHAELTERLGRPNRPAYGLIGLHLTNFDPLNDLCGATTALQLEQSAAALLQSHTSGKIAARMSAGRFAALIEADSLAQVRQIARAVYSQLSGQLFRTENGSIRLQVSVAGLLIEDKTAVNSEDCVLSLGDAQAIAASVRDPQIFVEPLSQTMIDARRAYQTKIEQLREAIREHRFKVHAQPIMDPDAPPGMVSYEALIRLLDKDGTLVRPPQFLSLAVQTQMTPIMDRGMITKVFSWLGNNPEALARTYKCSINLSGLTMSDGTIASHIREQRILHNIPPEKVVFEITESEAIRNPSAASRLVDELKAMGFGIALDDFGTGLATFEYLKRFPIDYLKIDGSFIRNLTSNAIDEEIVISTIRVAKRLNVRTIAEHVHNEEIYDRLIELGVTRIQGNHTGEAIPLEDIFTTPPFVRGPLDSALAAASPEPLVKIGSDLSTQRV